MNLFNFDYLCDIMWFSDFLDDLVYFGPFTCVYVF